jgi:hypothetical protein
MTVVVNWLFGDFTNTILFVVALVVVFGLTERWRLERNAQKKRERQNLTDTCARF